MTACSPCSPPPEPCRAGPGWIVRGEVGRDARAGRGRRRRWLTLGTASAYPFRPTMSPRTSPSSRGLVRRWPPTCCSTARWCCSTVASRAPRRWPRRLHHGHRRAHRARPARHVHGLRRAAPLRGAAARPPAGTSAGPPWSGWTPSAAPHARRLSPTLHRTGPHAAGRDGGAGAGGGRREAGARRGTGRAERSAGWVTVAHRRSQACAWSGGWRPERAGGAGRIGALLLGVPGPARAGLRRPASGPGWAGTAVQRAAHRRGWRPSRRRSRRSRRSPATGPTRRACTLVRAGRSSPRSPTSGGRTAGRLRQPVLRGDARRRGAPRTSVRGNPADRTPGPITARSLVRSSRAGAGWRRTLEKGATDRGATRR
jgi:hypothetical protein